MRKNTSEWLAHHKLSPQAKMRLFCFPYAGGGAVIYRNWSDMLPQDIEVCPVQLPGRGKRLMEPAYTRLMPLVEDLVPALFPYFDRPFAFFGHSMGAMISYELSRVLNREYKIGPDYLFISGRRAPHLPPVEWETYRLPEAEFIENLRNLEGTPAEILENEELMQLMLPLLRADFEVVQSYNHILGPPLDCPLSVYGGLGDSRVRKEHLEAWRKHTTSSFRLRMFPGNHFFLRTSQHQLIRSLLTDLQICMRLVHGRAS